VDAACVGLADGVVLLTALGLSLFTCPDPQAEASNARSIKGMIWLTRLIRSAAS
jgi:hypothetical protein